MHSYEHKKLVTAVVGLNQEPADSEIFSEWVHAQAHLEFLGQNAHANDFVVYASSKHAFIHAVAVPNDRLFPLKRKDLMGWNLNPYTSIASYVSGGRRSKVWVERGLSGSGTKTLKHAVQLVFARTFEGWSGPGHTYYEVHQEYSHLADIHWRPEKSAYCRFDGNGDLEPVVSIATRGGQDDDIALVSFRWEPLEEYLVASNSSLVRMFDFPLYRSSSFSGWSDAPERRFRDSDLLFYRQKVMAGHASYTRGVQIVRPRRKKKSVFARITDGWSGDSATGFVEFTALDWRNGEVTKISTDPEATANYFNSEGNSLPFELSPAFFRPEVLSKYKTDREKYTVTERSVSCRTAWHLKGIDVNEAGQVHAYICDLRSLPHNEQLHWLCYNEAPKGTISEGAFTSDFEGKWATQMEPLPRLLSIVRRWHRDKVLWWTLRDEKLLERVNTPLTTSRDEWAEAFMDLAKLVVEGFETKPIRSILDGSQVSYKNDDKTIALLERVLDGNNASDEAHKLAGLRTVQLVRSKAKGHVGGSGADQLVQDVLMEYETFANHFRHICAQVADELETIEGVMLDPLSDPTGNSQ